MKRLAHGLGFAVLVLAGWLVMNLHHGALAADYSNTHLMDDQVFDKVGSMSSTAISAFLNGADGKIAGGSTCLKSYQTPNFHFDGTNWRYGDITTTDSSDPNYVHRWDNSFGPANISAAQAIYQAAQQWGLNPQVIIATLQKEGSLITGAACDAWRYASAMGYGCPDSGGCNPKYAGLTRQMLWGSWQLKFNKERSYGNTAWDGDGDITYVGFMTQGNRKRCDTCQTFTFDGNITVDGQTIHIENGTTASLYTFTPHLGQSFPGIFETWFGSVMVPAYSWQLVWQYAYTDATETTGKSTVGLLPGDKVYVGFTAKNTGNITWTNSGASPIKVGTINPLDRNSAFCDPATWGFGCNRPATMKEASVAPGETGAFEFWFIAPNAPGTYDERFSLIIDGQSWFPDLGLTFHTTVLTPVYSWQFVWQYAYTDQTKTVGKGTNGLLPGDRVYVGFQARNTGNMTWYRDGAHPVNVGMTHPIDRASPFYDGTWLGTNRPTHMVEASVPPGQVGTFEFWLKAPNTPGTYSEYYSLVAEGAAWMNDPGLNFYNTVVAPVYSWQLTWQYAYTDQTKTTAHATTGLHPGDRVFVGFKAKNTGNVTWSNSGPNPVNVGMTHPLDRSSAFYDATWLGQNRPAHMVEASVPPGQVGTFEYWIKAPNTPGVYPEYFSLVAEGKAWLNDPGMNFYSSVTP